mmetsp:Transcript_41646/g.90775  ORF Transcript_41646/g.90775 Transcript_41646/m.90775 type:complete len:674 (-) Transcript_41646:4-2025(-)
MSDILDLPDAGADATGERAIASLFERLAAPQLRAACECGDLPTVQQSLPRIGSSSQGARKALQLAVSHGQAAVVRYLLDEGVPLEPAEHEAGVETLESAPYAVQAALADSAEVVRLLVEHRASLLEPGLVATLERRRGTGVVRVNLMTTPLGAAAWGLRLQALGMIAELMSTGGDSGLNATAELRPLGTTERRPSSRPQEFTWAHGATPLVLAMHAAGRAEAGGDAGAKASTAAKALLDQRADPVTTAANGEAALHIAARHGLTLAVEELLRAGADPIQRNAQGDTAEQVATRAGRSACAAVLRAAADAAGACTGPVLEAMTALEEEEAQETARLDRQRERQREKRTRQRRQRSQRHGAETGDALDASEDEDEHAGARSASARATGTAAQGSEARSQSAQLNRLSCEQLRARIGQARRDNSRSLRQARSAAQKRDEEVARSERTEAALEELGAQREQLWQRIDELSPQVLAADQREKDWRLEVQRESEARAALHQASEEEASDHREKESKLRSELVALTAIQEGSDDGHWSRSTEQLYRKMADDRCAELEAALESLASALEPALRCDQLPPLLVAQTAGGPLGLHAAHVEVHRQLHERRRQHLNDMRGLAVLTNKQLEERGIEYEKELDAVIGKGLPHLLQALHQEGVVSGYKEPKIDKSRLARLRATLSDAP